LISGLNADTSLARRICHPNEAASNMKDQGPASALRHAAPRQELPGDTHG
jgi:hypothetical protein